jgi:hydroxymethylbilane synthase
LKITIATRGSALALAQSNMVLNQCRAAFPDFQFELKIIKTTGDKMQTASLARIDATVPRGLFTKELEEALLQKEADLAVHSLKDLPTELPEGLVLGAVSEREDARDVLIRRLSDLKDAPMVPPIGSLPQGARIGTSSTRRAAQLLALRPDLQVVPIRGNVGTRLQKLAGNGDFDGIILAAAGLVRLGFQINGGGVLRGESAPDGVAAAPIPPEQMLPCAGQAALGIEIRDQDPRIESICARLNDAATRHCVLAERAFLKAMGGGCQSAIAAYADVMDGWLRLRAVSFLGETARHGELSGPLDDATALGEQLAAELKPAQ